MTIGGKLCVGVRHHDEETRDVVWRRFIYNAYFVVAANTIIQYLLSFFRIYNLS